MPEATAVGRAGRRSRSRQAILTAARELFSELGYEQTTVRAIAQRADLDPALVMKHFGSKDNLFDAVSELSLGFGGALTGPPGLIGERLLRHVIADLEQRPDRSMPVLRSMLTHPQAAEAVRCAVADPGNSPLADALTGEDVELRAALASAIVLGLLVARYLLKVPDVAAAAPESLARLLGPSLQALLDGDEPAGRPPYPEGATAPGAPDEAPRERPGDQQRLTRLAAAEAYRAAAARRVDALAHEALADGASFGAVGQAVGISRQAARKRWGHGEPRPQPGGSAAQPAVRQP
jgi:AcrR family transcriptional regulator